MGREKEEMDGGRNMEEDAAYWQTSTAPDNKNILK